MLKNIFKGPSSISSKFWFMPSSIFLLCVREKALASLLFAQTQQADVIINDFLSHVFWKYILIRILAIELTGLINLFFSTKAHTCVLWILKRMVSMRPKTCLDFMMSKLYAKQFC